MSKVLFHVATDIDDNPIDAVFVDGNGRKYVIPSGEPTEIESDYMADRIAEHCRHYGIVEVLQVRTKKGVDWEMDKAKTDAAEALLLAEKSCINDYIRTQLESRVKQNVPPLPPEGRALSCVIRHKYNLKRAGLHIVGWEPPYDMPDDIPAPGTVSSDIDQRIKMLENDNAKLRDMLMQFMQTTLANQQREQREQRGAKVGSGKQQSTPEPEPEAKGVQISTVSR